MTPLASKAYPIFFVPFDPFVPFVPFVFQNFCNRNSLRATSMATRYGERNL